MVKSREHKFFNSLPDFEKEAEEEKRLRKMPKSPSFSLDDMEDARKAAYDKGHEKGLQSAKDSIEQQTEILVQSLTNRIHDLEQAEIERHETSIINSVTITEKAIKRLLPELLDQNAHGLIKESLSRFFADHTPKSALTLSVHPDMVKPIEKHAHSLSPTMIVKGNESLSTVQAKLEWTDGQYDFKPDQMVTNILEVIQKQLPNNKDDSLDDSSKTPHNDESNTKQQDSLDHE